MHRERARRIERERAKDKTIERERERERERAKDGVSERAKERERKSAKDEGDPSRSVSMINAR
jgi:hypothetical protein